MSKVRKVAILGSRSVGKSSLAIQFVDQHFTETYFPTIESKFTKEMRWNQQDFTVEIIDTAGQDEFSILNSKHAVGIHGYILVYSLASLQSFEIVQQIHDKILNFMGVDHIPTCLVANKNDLMAQRQVPREEGERLAKEWGCAFLEVSCKHHQGVHRVFELMIGEIEKVDAESRPEKNACVIL